MIQMININISIYERDPKKMVEIVGVDDYAAFVKMDVVDSMDESIGLTFCERTPSIKEALLTVIKRIEGMLEYPSIEDAMHMAIKEKIKENHETGNIKGS